ncbi:DUF4494 domain-containing protein [Porphyromonas gingivalis]|uniref:DUF4494 domain-containing protein n=1 Tax=Porphyromonas gingivalis TaxID=837 RepID=A0AAE9X755_PORGN|nr:DUF4494 domain-containing protein [Porphyromonas gingivalis]MDP0530850.1 DUF4494 domain-containing protein [Porphyromonas gingivalis]MDP0625744.1 DUF4494 domain-containing protein [Porphyromonas gingivalis]WCF99163.1 DUF4494 domain-containing protein [Porphyromonas gingivalis]WKD52830.1 DUF4494 domain-containing protein [Porphyromonas gingivalis]WKD54878.1 DUF4494 domain-containing protein [Porphyromonas gingivalis]
MVAWFECKVTYEKVADNGMPKKVVESYLVDADSFTLAEAKMIEEITPFVSMGEFNISNIRKVNYAELFLNEDDKCDRYYRCKVLYVTIDEKNGVEKKTPAFMLVKSDSLPNAVAELEKQMGKGLADYEIASVAETALMDVFQYVPAQ